MIVELHNSPSSMILNCFVSWHLNISLLTLRIIQWKDNTEFLLLDNIYTIEDKCSLTFAFNLFISLPFFLLYDSITPALKNILKNEKTQTYYLTITTFLAVNSWFIFVLCMVIIIICTQFWIWFFEMHLTEYF